MDDATSPADRELVLSRMIDAPPHKVYRAWTEPELLKQWFAPAPFTTPVAELDVRPGGANLIVMRSADGKGISESRRLSRNRAQRAAGVYGRLYGGVATLGKAIHDRDPDLRG
jgi:uncharacterized protein YndB with AHSA1/START domain